MCSNKGEPSNIAFINRIDRSQHGTLEYFKNIDKTFRTDCQIPGVNTGNVGNKRVSNICMLNIGIIKQIDNAGLTPRNWVLPLE